MVMSQEVPPSPAGGKASPGLPRDRDSCRERVSDREKELAAEASGAFTKGDYTGCLNSLEKLEVRRDLGQSWMLRNVRRCCGPRTVSWPTTRSSRSVGPRLDSMWRSRR